MRRLKYYDVKSMTSRVTWRHWWRHQ